MPSSDVKQERELIDRANKQHLLVSRADATASGYSAWRWERAQDEGLWLQIAPDQLHHAATPLTFEMSVRAGASWLGKRGALFGAAALLWLGVEVPEVLKAEFLVPRSLRSIPNWMTIHTTTQWDPADVLSHNGVRTTTATRAILDYATSMPTAAQLEVAIDSAIKLRRTTQLRLARRLETLRGTGRHGVRLLSELLLDSGGESYLERRFLRLLRTAGLPRPDCQVIFRDNGQRVARVDFSFPATKTVVEVSGRLGHTSDRDRQRDARRRNRLQQMGSTVLEFTTADVIGGHAYVLRSLSTSLGVAS